MTQPIEELYSSDGWYKAEIQRRGDGVIEVGIFKWTQDIVPDYGVAGPPFWEPVPGGPVLADSHSTARPLCVEELERLSGSAGVKSVWSRPELEHRRPPGTAPRGEAQSQELSLEGDASECSRLESLRGPVSMIMFLAVLLSSLSVSPVVWWLYGPGWAIGAAIASALIFGFTPFIHLFKAVLFINLILCVCALGKLLFF